MRSANRPILDVPWCRLKAKGEWAIAGPASKVWNNLISAQLEALEFLTQSRKHTGYTQTHINIIRYTELIRIKKPTNTLEHPENKGAVISTGEKPFLATQFVPGEFQTIL